jgi:hypothetical protein
MYQDSLALLPTPPNVISSTHNSLYGPCLFYARKGMLQRFNFAVFSKGDLAELRGFLLKERAKRNPVAAGPAYEKSLRSRRLAGRGIQRGRDGEKSKSAAEALF